MTAAIHPEIPAEKAWREGRRIYVRCGKNSKLNGQLRDLGAKWDWDAGALWTGSGKLEQVIPLILAEAERADATAAVKALGLWVKIPFDATDIREHAKLRLAGAYDGERKEWAMPSQAALDEVRAMIAARMTAKASAPKPAAKLELSEDEVIASSGRTVTGEKGTGSGRLDGRGKRDWAEQAKPQPGEVRRLKDGRRMLVLSSTVNFLDSDAIEDQWPGQEPGWYFSYRAVEVGPTEAEQAQDAEDAARAADGEAIAAAFAQARKACQPSEALSPGHADGPSVTLRPTMGYGEDGKVTLAADGTLHYYHPGYYDDYRAVQGSASDPEAVAAFRAILAAGTRTRETGSRQYEVRA